MPARTWLWLAEALRERSPWMLELVAPSLFDRRGEDSARILALGDGASAAALSAVNARGALGRSILARLSRLRLPFVDVPAPPSNGDLDVETESAALAPAPARRRPPAGDTVDRILRDL